MTHQPARVECWSLQVLLRLRVGKFLRLGVARRGWGELALWREVRKQRSAEAVQSLVARKWRGERGFLEGEEGGCRA